jgi:hypothetical protein
MIVRRRAGANSPGKRRSPSSQSTSLRDGDGALLDAAVAFVEIDIGRVAPGIFEEALNLSTQCRLVGFDGEKIAGLAPFGPRERDEEKWNPVPRIPLSTLGIDHVYDIGLFQSNIIVI